MMEKHNCEYCLYRNYDAEEFPYNYVKCVLYGELIEIVEECKNFNKNICDITQPRRWQCCCCTHSFESRHLRIDIVTGELFCYRCFIAVGFDNVLWSDLTEFNPTETNMQEKKYMPIEDEGRFEGCEECLYFKQAIGKNCKNIDCRLFGTITWPEECKHWTKRDFTPHQPRRWQCCYCYGSFEPKYLRYYEGDDSSLYCHECFKKYEGNRTLYYDLKEFVPNADEA